MSKYKTKQGLMAMVLSIIMVMSMMPASALAETGVLPIDTRGEITDFDTLGTEIAELSVPLGTSEVDLELPSTLKATVKLAASKEAPILDSEEVDSKSDKTESMSGATSGIDETDDPLSSEGSEIPSPPDAEETRDSAEAEPVENDGDSAGEVTIPLSVTWASSPQYDSEATGTYIFSPELPEGFALTDGVALPTITVTVGTAAITGEVTAFMALPDDIRWQNTTAPEFPETLGGTVEGEPGEIAVTWAADHDYDAEYPQRGLYVFTAVLGEGYSLADGVELPRIAVYIPQKVGRMMARMAGGGTTDSPLEITTAAQLAEIATLVNARENGLELFLFNDADAHITLELQNDIDLSIYTKGEGWVPIGGKSNQFKGTFDGGGHKLSNLTIDRSGMEYQGLFGKIGVGSLVKNLGIVNTNIISKGYVGGVTGAVCGGTVQNCYTTGSVGGRHYVGGVVGYVSDSTVQNCYTSSNVVGISGSFMIGGLAGGVYDSTVKTCYVTGSVTGGSSSTYTGGLAGYFIGESTMQNCAALNRAVGERERVGRVIGNRYIEFPVGNSLLSDNIAFGGMTVTQYGSAKTPVEGPDQVDGESKTAAEIKAAGFFEALFENDPAWTYAEDKLPVLTSLSGQNDALPAYIAGLIGAGTNDDPYRIYTAADLKYMADMVNSDGDFAYGKYFRLENDIDLSAYGKEYDSGKGWVPIGRNGFVNAVFDGNGKTITGLYINRSNEIHIGLFGSVTHCTIRNLFLQSIALDGGTDYSEGKIGGLAGKVNGGSTISGCAGTGRVSGEGMSIAYCAGGLVGFLEGGSTLNNCAFYGTVSARGKGGSEPTSPPQIFAGGIAGGLYNGSAVTNCISVANVSATVGNAYSGGIAGQVDAGAKIAWNVALGAEVFADTAANRIAGIITSTASGDPNNKNYAWSGMKANGYTVSGLANNSNGEDADASALQTLWTTGPMNTWDPSLWALGHGKLPVLTGLSGQNDTLPSHISGGYFMGAGTSESDPYLIKTAADLAKLSELVNTGTSPYAYPGVFYRLENNLDLSAYAKGVGWVPIGTNMTYGFKGNFDGNNKSITGLTINCPTSDNVGLFGYLFPGSKVQNIKIIGASVKGKNNVGGVAGYAWGMTVENCAVSGSISGGEHVGGVVGFASGSTVKYCYSTGSVTGTGDYVGGVVGYLEYNTTMVQSCYSIGNVEGSYCVGGVVGEVGAATVQNCYNTANVRGNYFIGGVAGSVGTGTIQNCYSSGSVLGTNEYIGGVLGFLSSGTVKNCVALNPSIDVGTYNFGRVVGSLGSSGTLSHNYAFSQIPGTWENKGLDKKDGADVTLQTLFGGNFWTRATYWDTSAWDGMVWMCAGDKLPLLFFGLAEQSGNGGLYLTARDIRYATVGTVGAFTYNGSEQVPSLNITFDGQTLTKGMDYIISITSTDGSGTSSGTNVGEVTLTISGIGNFKGTKTLTYTIDKAPLTILSAAINPKIYDGTSTAEVANVNFYGLQLVETLTLGTDYTVTGAQFNSADAGTNKNVTATVALANTQKANNYALVNGSLNETGLSIVKATAATVPNIVKNVLYTNTASQTVNIADQIAFYKRTGDTLIYAVGTVSGTDPGIIQTSSVNEAGVLTFTANGSVGDTATIPVIVRGFGNYNDITVNVSVRLTNKTPVTITATMNGGVYTGSAYSYSGAVVKCIDNNVDVTGAINLKGKYESTDGAGYSSMVAPTDVGTYRLTLSVPDSNENYIGSEVFIFTIEKRQITLAADNKTILKGASLPQLTYTVSNLPIGKNKADALSTEPILACPTFDGNTTGSYSITLTGGKATDNYTITTRIGGTLTVAEQNYIVNFNLNGGLRTGGGELTQTIAKGSAATAPTVTRSNHTFIGWDKSFENVTSDLTVTANWRNDGGGGGGSSSDSSRVIVTPPAPDKPNSPTQGEIKVHGTMDSKGNVIVNITDKTMTDAINKALAKAKKNGIEQNGISLVLRVDTTSKTCSKVTVNLPKAVQDTIIEKKIVNIVIVADNPGIEIGMDLATVKEINKQAKTDVNITANRIDSDNLAGESKKAIGGRPVFDLKVNYGIGKQVQGFGAGSVSVAIPYTLAPNEKAGNVQAVYVDSMGKVHWIVNSVYDDVEKILRFSTNHFSTYGIGYKQANTAFTDIAGHWAKGDIEFVVSCGLFSGTSTTTFSPNIAMTRGMFVAALGRLANADVSSYTKSSFTDVKDNAYYMGYIEWASKNSIVNGVGDNKFAPDQSITREQMAVIVQNYAKVMGFTLPRVHMNRTFADSAKISTYARNALEQMQMAGIISGKSANLLDPQGTATRAEVSAVLRRFVELANSSDTL